MAIDNVSTSETGHPGKRALALTMIGLGLMLAGGAALAMLIMGAVKANPVSEYKLVIPAVVKYAAPEIAVQDLQGNPVSLAALRGKVVLVNNWATWCPPCKAEMPVLQAYYEDYKDQGFLIIAIDAGEASVDVTRYVDENELTFPVWVDPGETALRAFRETYLPSSYVIDAQGQVRLYWSGVVSREMLDKWLTPLLEE